jgi:hypothetical protein
VSGRAAAITARGALAGRAVLALTGAAHRAGWLAGPGTGAAGLGAALLALVAIAGAGRALVLAGLVLVLAGCAVIGHHVRQHGGGRLAWRWLSGHPLDGAARTDAGWLRRGVKPLTAAGHASRWAHLPRAQRAAWRTGGTCAGLAVAFGLAVNRGATLAGLAAVALVALGGGAWAGYRGASGLRHHLAWVRPLHLALAPQLGVPLAARPSSWLTVPRDYARREGAEIRIDLPVRALPGDDGKRALTAIVREKLALEDAPRADWHLSGGRPHVLLTVQIPPPPKVTLGMVRELVAAARECAPLLGLGRGRRATYADLDGDSPHVLVSAGSGGGKSVTTRALVAQILARGGVALILDVKRLSHAWARGLPNVRYCRDVAEIHEALVWLQGELDRRNRLADEGADMDGNTDHVDVGPRLVVLAEEMNATANRLASHYRKIRRDGDPAVSPAVDALADALFMGRQVKVNVIAVAQMLTARTIGGGEARENMGVRILARYTLNAWRVLVPEIWPAPRSSRHAGRVQVCVAGKARETQVLFTTPAEARELATSGKVSAFPGGRQARASARPSGGGRDRLHVVPEPGQLVGLGEAVRVGGPLGGLTLDAVRQARKRDAEFPPKRGEGGGEYLYDPGELAAWARNRPRAEAGARAAAG